MTKPFERAQRPPLDGVREAPFTLVRSAGDDDEPDDGLTLDGWGAVFNSPTVIRSYEGNFVETIALGSMKRSFRERPPVVQYDHGRHPLIGDIPIGALKFIAEEADPVLAPQGGAHVRARIFDNWMMSPVRDAIAANAISGMSFRFEVVRESWTKADGTPIKDDMALLAELEKGWDGSLPDDELPIRTLRELKILEIGPVMWPAYESTSVTVRSGIIDLDRLHDPEQRKLLARAVFTADGDVARGEPHGGPHGGGRRELDESLTIVRKMLLNVAERQAWLAGLPGGGQIGATGGAVVLGGGREVDRAARLVRAMRDDIEARQDMTTNRGRRRGRFDPPDLSVYTYSQAAERLSRLRGEFMEIQAKGEHLVTDADVARAEDLRGEITALRELGGERTAAGEAVETVAPQPGSTRHFSRGG